MRLGTSEVKYATKAYLISEAKHRVNVILSFFGYVQLTDRHDEPINLQKRKVLYLLSTNNSKAYFFSNGRALNFGNESTPHLTSVI